jgi:hypothetical protein
MNSPLAGAWLFFHIAGCGALLKNGYAEHRGLVWYACLAWLVMIGASTFLLRPQFGGAAFMWILAAMPSLALCLRREHLKPYLVCFGAIIACYALGLIVQAYLGAHYTYYNFEGKDGRSWPLLDPNNGAAVLNLALIPSFYMALTRPKWFAAVAVFVMALYITRSKAGALAAVAGCSLIMAQRHRWRFIIPALGMVCAGIIYAHYCKPWVLIGLLESFLVRFPIWEGSLPLLSVFPLTGLGMGTFGHYYAQTRVEQFTSGWWAHNDILQFAIELGIPAASIFCFLAVAVIVTTRKTNIASAAAMLAVFLQAMMECQLYTPCICLLMGLALAHHHLTCRPEKMIMRAGA